MENTEFKNLQQITEFITKEVHTNLRAYCLPFLTTVSVGGDNNRMIDELYDEFYPIINELIENDELYSLNSAVREEFYNGTQNDGFSMALYLKTKEVFEKYNQDEELDFD